MHDYCESRQGALVIPSAARREGPAFGGAPRAEGWASKKKGREIAAFPSLQDERLAVLFTAVRSTLSKILLMVPARRERGALTATLTALTRLSNLTALTRLTTLIARLLAVALYWVTRVRGFHKSLL